MQVVRLMRACVGQVASGARRHTAKHDVSVALVVPTWLGMSTTFVMYFYIHR